MPQSSPSRRWSLTGEILEAGRLDLDIDLNEQKYASGYGTVYKLMPKCCHTGRATGISFLFSFYWQHYCDITMLCYLKQTDIFKSIHKLTLIRVCVTCLMGLEPHSLLLIFQDTKTFPVQLRHSVSPERLRPSPSLTCPRRHPTTTCPNHLHWLFSVWRSSSWPGWPGPIQHSTIKQHTLQQRPCGWLNFSSCL